MDKTVSLRPAVEADFPAIKELIRKARINPTRLDWRRFTVAISRFTPSGDEKSELVGCVQLKPVPGGLVELASLVVRSDFRGQGLARSLIEHILAESPRPLYLTCRSGLGVFYEKFGFQALDTDEMPRYYFCLHRIIGALTHLTLRNETLLVMKLG